MPVTVRLRASDGALHDRVLPDPVVNPPGGMVRNRPANPALILYQGNTSGNAAAWAHPGALIIAGRGEYDAPGVHQAADGGATVLMYLDAIVKNTGGRYHQLLFNSSQFGPAVPGWPGNPVANSTGPLADFRVGGVLQQKLPGVIDLIVSENPHISGLFLDDCGSRSWFPNFNFDSWSSADKEAYRNGAIAICQAARAAADQHDLFVMVNGTWSSATGTSGSGGYPNRGQHGMSLADGGFIENHNLDAFWTAYATSPQWGAATPRRLAYTWASNVGNTGQRDAYVNANTVAFASTSSYGQGFVAPWRGFTDFGLPNRG